MAANPETGEQLPERHLVRLPVPSAETGLKPTLFDNVPKLPAETEQLYDGMSAAIAMILKRDQMLPPSDSRLSYMHVNGDLTVNPDDYSMFGADGEAAMKQDKADRDAQLRDGYVPVISTTYDAWAHSAASGPEIQICTVKTEGDGPIPYQVIVRENNVAGTPYAHEVAPGIKGIRMTEQGQIEIRRTSGDVTDSLTAEEQQLITDMLNGIKNRSYAQILRNGG